MKLNGKISIVVPTWNSAKYIDKLLRSLCEMLEQPDEYVFVDGNSVDGTEKMIEAFSPGVPVKCIRLPPSGVYSAWNSGIEQAIGEWVWIVCSDDIVLPACITHIRRGVNLASSTVGFISWFINVIDRNGCLISRQIQDSPLLSIEQKLGMHPHIRSADLEVALIYFYRSYFLSFMAHAFRRSLWVERPFDPSIGSSADIDWTIAAHLRGWSRLHLPETLAEWRVQPDSVTSRSTPFERLKAHDQLRHRYFPLLKEQLGLSPREILMWQGSFPAHDVFEWFAVLRMSRNFTRAIYASAGIIRCAGWVGAAGLALRRLGLFSSYSYSRPARQFVRLFTLNRLKSGVVRL